MTTGVYERSPKEKIRLQSMIKEVGFKPKKGVRISPDSEFKKGSIPWNKGVSCSEETKLKISQHHREKGIKPKVQFVAYGEAHPQWKGGKTPLIMKIRKPLFKRAH